MKKLYKKSLLSEAYNSLREFEKTGKVSIVYKVYDNKKLIYIGKGGSRKTKAHKRLYDHHLSWCSSFKHKFLHLDRIYKGMDVEKAFSDWDSLKWDVYLVDFDKLTDTENMLIKKYKPIYNEI